MSTIVTGKRVSQLITVVFRFTDIVTGLGLQVDQDDDFIAEFFSGDGTTVNFTGTSPSATAPSVPAIVESSDVGGFLYTLTNVDTTGFTPGLLRVELTANIEGDPILSSPLPIYTHNLAAILNRTLYCTIQDIKDEGPSDLPSSWTDTLITRYIQFASQECDDHLLSNKGNLYRGLMPFKSAPDTPITLQKAACYLTLGDLFERMRTLDRQSLQGSETGQGRELQTPGMSWRSKGLKILMALAPAKGAPTMKLSDVVSSADVGFTSLDTRFDERRRR